VSVYQETNMVFVCLPGAIAKVLPDYLREQGVLILAMNPLRLVLHKDVDRADLQRFVEVLTKMGSVTNDSHLSPTPL